MVITKHYTTTTTTTTTTSTQSYHIKWDRLHWSNYIIMFEQNTITPSTTTTTKKH